MYTSWPKVLSQSERTLVVLSHGHRYDLQPADDSESNTLFCLYKDGDAIANVHIDKGKVFDFCVSQDLVAIATIKPAGLYLCRTWKESQILYLRFPLEDEAFSASSSVTIGNFGSNILVLWHGPEAGPVYVGMISGKDAFRFDYKVLRYYNDKGHLRAYLRQDGERVLAVPNFPRQMGVVCTLTGSGMKFFGLRPFYTLNKLTDDLIESPLLYNIGSIEPMLQANPSRLQFDAYNMVVKINNNHLSMKYDPLNSIKEAGKDWIKITVNDTELEPTDTIFMTPLEVEQSLTIEAKEELGSIELHADLPVAFRLSTQMPKEALPNLGISYLLKGQKADILMRPMQCFTPFALARFIEKFNVKIRAEVWS